MSIISGIEWLKNRIFAIEEKLGRVPHHEWGTVTSSAPLRVRLDRHPDPLPDAPATLVAGLRAGDRVLVKFENRRPIIMGRGGGTEWVTLPLAPGVTVHAGKTPEARYVNGALELRGAVAASFTTAYTTVLPTGALPPMDGYHSVRLNPSGGGAPAGRSYIDTDGSMKIATTSGTASYYLLNNLYLF